MALHWNFENDRIGTLFIIEDSKTFSHPIYDGNAFAIFTSEWIKDGEKMYNVYNFFADEKHAKNCLGLTKEYKDDNIFSDKNTKWEFNSKKKNAVKLAQMIVKSGLKTTITMI